MSCSINNTFLHIVVHSYFSRGSHDSSSLPPFLAFICYTYKGVKLLMVVKVTYVLMLSLRTQHPRKGLEILSMAGSSQSDR